MVLGKVSVSSEKLGAGINTPILIDGYGQNENFVNDVDYIIFNFDLRRDLNTTGNILSLFEHEYLYHGKMNLRQKMSKPDVHFTEGIYKMQVKSPIFKYTSGRLRKTTLERSKR
jgi:hypothetical protein